MGDNRGVKILLALGGLFAAVPTVAFAHTKWFADENLTAVADDSRGLYLLAWGIIAVLAVLVGMYLEQRGALQLSFLKPKRPDALARAASMFTMVVGAFLVIAGTHYYLFSPNLGEVNGVPAWMVTLQVIIGLAFLTGVLARVAALALAGLWALGMYFIGVEVMLEDIWVLGTALFILIMGNDYFSLVSWKMLGRWARQWKPYALPVLRVGAGATLLILGFSEKILRPEYGVNFLQQHDWNFMQFLGFEWFSDYLFTISAGAVEALFGLIFILGVVTRLNALVVAVVFTIPLFILGPMELSGHLPHFAAIVLLLFFGAGAHLKIPRKGSA